MATRSQDAVVRAAEAALRSNGGRVVLLRIPAPAASGAPAAGALARLDEMNGYLHSLAAI